MLREVVSYDHFIDERGNINVRKITRIMKGEEEISKQYHRTAVNPIDALTSDLDERTKQIANMLLKPETVEEYKQELSDAAEEAMEDGVITDEEKLTIWNRIKKYFMS